MRSEVTLADACELIVDCPHKTAPESQDAYAYAVGTKAIADGRVDFSKARPVNRATYETWIARATPQPGDVILCREAPVGPVTAVPESPRVCLGQRTVLLRPNANVVDPVYLLYALQQPAVQQELRTLSEGSTVAHVNVADVRRFSIPIPSLAEQRQAAAVLKALDDKIDSNSRLAETVERAAYAQFEAKLIDFIGFEATQESLIGPVPFGWSVQPFSDAVTINPRVKLQKGLMAPFIEMAAVDPWATRPSRIGEREPAGGAKFEHGDTLMARITGCIENGKGAFVDFIDTAGTGSTEFLVLRAKPPFTPEMVFFYSRWPKLRAHAIANMTGSSGRQRVPNSCFDDFLVATPDPYTDLTGVADFLRVAMKKSLALWQETRSLTEARDRLLPGLVSGAIPVGDLHDGAEEGAERPRELVA